LDVQIEEIKTSWLGGSSPMDADQRETAGNYSKYGEFTELERPSQSSLRGSIQGREKKDQG
jgi:hypothetical protein